MDIKVNSFTQVMHNYNALYHMHFDHTVSMFVSLLKQGGADLATWDDVIKFRELILLN